MWSKKYLLMDTYKYSLNGIAVQPEQIWLLTKKVIDSQWSIGGYFFLCKYRMSVIMSDNVAMTDNVNCASKLKASYVVFEPLHPLLWLVFMVAYFYDTNKCSFIVF